MFSSELPQIHDPANKKGIKTSAAGTNTFLTFVNYLYDTYRQTRHPLIESGVAGFHLNKRRTHLFDGVPDG